MKTIRLNIESALSTKLSGILALLVIFVVAAACSFNTGADMSKEKKNDSDKKTTRKSALSDDDVASMKKATGTKSSKKSGATSENADEGDFIPVYSEIKNEKYEAFNQRFKDEKTIETITDSLNEILSLPTDVSVTFKDCGEVNAWYQPKTKTITFCYEFMEFFHEKALEMGKSEEDANQIMIGATLFFFFHELGHCLIDVYDLPATGREEDSVDQLSTFILMDETDEVGQGSAGAGVLMFKAMSENEQPSAGSFADEHSLSSQRFYNVACWMYGRDQSEYGFFVEEGILPEARAARCPTEYKKMSSAWKRLTEPWMKK